MQLELTQAFFNRKKEAFIANIDKFPCTEGMKKYLLMCIHLSAIVSDMYGYQKSDGTLGGAIVVNMSNMGSVLGSTIVFGKFKTELSSFYQIRGFKPSKNIALGYVYVDAPFTSIDKFDAKLTNDFRIKNRAFML